MTVAVLKHILPGDEHDDYPRRFGTPLNILNHFYLGYRTAAYCRDTPCFQAAEFLRPLLSGLCLLASLPTSR